MKNPKDTRRLGLRRSVKVVAGVLGLVMLAACSARDGADPTDPDTPAAGVDPALTPGIYRAEAPGEPTTGGTLTYAAQGEPRSLDPSVTISGGATGGTEMLAIYGQLARYDYEAQEFVPHMAESFESNDDYTQWTVHLRDDVQFSDGTPMDADAVVASVNYYVENKGYDFALMAPAWGSVEAVDDTTVRFNLTQPWATFSTMLARGPGLVVAPAAIAGGPEHFKPIGAGPFVVDHYAPQEELVLRANADYWDGAPYLDTLRFVWLGADETKVDALNAGQVHAAYLRSGPLIKQLREDDQPGYLDVHNLGHLVKMNSSEGRPASDERVRRAMALAIDPQVFIDRAYEGVGIPSKSVFSPISRWSNDVPPLPTNVEEARSLLDEAKADGFDGEIEILTGSDPTARDSSLAIQGMLESAGFTVTVETARSTADLIQRTYFEKDYDINVGGDALFDEDPFISLAFTIHGKSASNAIGFDDPEMNDLIDELRGVPQEDRADVLRRIEQRFQETIPSLPLAPATPFLAWGKNVHGIQPSHVQQLDFSKAWVE